MNEPLSSSATIKHSVATLFSFNINAYFEQAEKPILNFMAQVNLFEEKYKTLFSTFGENYDNYSYAPPSDPGEIANIENLGPNFRCDVSMRSFHHDLQRLRNEMDIVIAAYEPKLAFSRNILSKCCYIIEEKILSIKIPAALEALLKMKQSCEALLKDLVVQREQLDTFVKDSDTIKEILENESNEKKMTFVEDYIHTGLVKDCKKTVNEANAFLKQEKTKKFITKLSLMHEKCENKDTVYDAANGLLANIQQKEAAYEKASSKVRYIR